MADDGVGDVGARLRQAEQARGQAAKETRLRAKIADAIGPEAFLLAARAMPEEPGRQRDLVGSILRLAERAALAVLDERHVLQQLGPGKALLLDGRGGREVIDNPTSQIGGAP